MNGTTISLVTGDIVHQTTDAVVNAANTELKGGSGVDGAIHTAGGPSILEECRLYVNRHGNLPIGKAVATTAGDLKAKHVIHTVGPMWHSNCEDKPGLLASAYTESLMVAEKLGLKSISFPSISTGAYKYPFDQAAKIAISTVIKFVKEDVKSVNSVIFVLHDSTAYQVYAKALEETLGSMNG